MAYSMGIWIQWNGMVEWNGGLDWNGGMKWNSKLMIGFHLRIDHL